MKPLSKLLLIAGKKRSGKDTTADFLIEALTLKGYTVDRYNFASPMKQILATTLDISLEELDMFKNDTTYPHRGYLQRLGTEAIKPLFGTTVWSKLAAEFISKSSADFIVIPDFRFPEELSELHTYKTINIEVNSKPLHDTHISENALNSFKFDYTVQNNSTLPVLQTVVEELANTLCKEYT